MVKKRRVGGNDTNEIKYNNNSKLNVIVTPGLR